MTINVKSIIGAGIVLLVGLIAAIIGINVNLGLQTDGEGFKAEIQLSEEQVPAAITDDKGEVVETTEYNGEPIPTVDEIDGGMFEDKDTGVSATDGEYEDLGWSEWYPTDTPEAFRDATINKCIIANNRYGAQCVSLARVFWWSYANRDVSTCGTGLAKGMMNCWQENAGDEFETHWGSNGIQIGAWAVFDGPTTGHICQIMGPVVNGYVACLGENQGGHKCEGYGGAATNIINISIKNIIGYYMPKSYIKPAPAPAPTPEPVADACKVRTVVKGDTMAKIMKECTGEVKWGTAMNEYAEKWYSTKMVNGQNVFDGWASVRRVGLFAGDVIEWRGQ